MRIIGLQSFYSLLLTFFLNKKSNKKVKEKIMLRIFSGPTHKDSDNSWSFIYAERKSEDPTA